ncbi:F0F1 ATP synthase subunit gamma [Buchnera aphidicola]|uniref:F0F1 ATP synthase subunit gamma n=1 Tax=Buchnera aphidicola TaxID=9 RepID=UPI00346387FF
MRGKKEIRNKIKSVINTQKITKAMEMVAVSKMRKAEHRMRSGRPYSDIIQNVINHVVEGSLEYKHSYLEKRVTKRIGMIIISTDRGLCGSLNTNLFKKVLLKIQSWKQINISCDFILFGAKSFSFFQSYKKNILSKKSNIGDYPVIIELINNVEVILKKYQNNEIDKIFIAYNKFHNRLLQYPTIYQLLPLIQSKIKKPVIQIKKWDYLYEPDSKLILDLLFERYIESQVYQSILENIASEQAARMVAMKTAADNSDNFIKELQLIYNKLRQASITQELTEIVAGASAVSVN